MYGIMPLIVRARSVSFPLTSPEAALLISFYSIFSFWAFKLVSAPLVTLSRYTCCGPIRQVVALERVHSVTWLIVHVKSYRLGELATQLKNDNFKLRYKLTTRTLHTYTLDCIQIGCVKPISSEGIAGYERRLDQTLSVILVHISMADG
jgi:hypothetical protein